MFLLTFPMLKFLLKIKLFLVKGIYLNFIKKVKFTLKMKKLFCVKKVRIKLEKMKYEFIFEEILERL